MSHLFIRPSSIGDNCGVHNGVLGIAKTVAKKAEATSRDLSESMS
jgi:hypothetical protein